MYSNVVGYFAVIGDTFQQTTQQRSCGLSFWREKVGSRRSIMHPLFTFPHQNFTTQHTTVSRSCKAFWKTIILSIIKPATTTIPTVKMTTLRQFKMDDLLKFNNVNLDVLTETYNMPFVSSIRPVVLPCPSLVSHRLDLSLNHCSIYLTCRGGQNLSVVRNTLVPQHTHSCGEY